MDFVRSYFGTNEPLTSWTLFSSLFDWSHSKPVKKWEKKGSTGQRFIFTEVTSYKIQYNTLAMKPKLLDLPNFVKKMIKLRIQFQSSKNWSEAELPNTKFLLNFWPGNSKRVFNLKSYYMARINHEMWTFDGFYKKLVLFRSNVTKITVTKYEICLHSGWLFYIKLSVIEWSGNPLMFWN